MSCSGLKKANDDDDDDDDDDRLIVVTRLCPPSHPIGAILPGATLSLVP